MYERCVKLLIDHRGPGGGSPALRKQLSILGEFIHSFAFWRMKPDNSVIKTSPGIRGRSLVERGRAYAIYLVGKGPTDLTVDLPAGELLVEWVETSDGSVAKRESFRHEGGEKRLESPAFLQDVALRIKAD